MNHFGQKSERSDKLRDDEMADSFQNEMPKARTNLMLNLHAGGASKKIELPLKLLVAGDFSNGQEFAPLPERNKVNLNKNNLNLVVSEYSKKNNPTIKNMLADDGSEDNISLTFQGMKDFTPEQVARQIPQLKTMFYMRNLVRDLKVNLLDNQAFRKELKKILLDPALSVELRAELSARLHTAHELMFTLSAVSLKYEPRLKKSVSSCWRRTLLASCAIPSMLS